MRKAGLAACLGVVVGAAACTGALAFPVAPPPGPPALVQSVAQGCGRGFNRGRRGECRRVRVRGHVHDGLDPRPASGRFCYSRPTFWDPVHVCE